MGAIIFTGRGGQSLSGGTRIFREAQIGDQFFSDGQRRNQNLWGSLSAISLLNMLFIFFFHLRHRYVFTIPYNMFIYNKIFPPPQGYSHFNLNTAISIVYVRGMFFHPGGARIFSEARGRDRNFSTEAKGGPEFVYVCKRGGTRKKFANHTNLYQLDISMSYYCSNSWELFL